MVFKIGLVIITERMIVFMKTKNIGYVKVLEDYFITINETLATTKTILKELDIELAAYSAALQRVPDGSCEEIPINKDGQGRLFIKSEEAAAAIVTELKKVAGLLKVYELDCTWRYFGTASFTADDYDAAVSQAMAPGFGMPQGEYINDSFEVEYQSELHILKCGDCGCEKEVPEYISIQWCRSCGGEMTFHMAV